MSGTNHFAGCKTAADAKTRHRALSRRWHPDRPNGDLRTMQEINAQYDRWQAPAAQANTATTESFDSTLNAIFRRVREHEQQQRDAARGETVWEYQPHPEEENRGRFRWDSGRMDRVKRERASVDRARKAADALRDAIMRFRRSQG